MIRSIYLRLKTASPDTNVNILAYKSVAISNDLYGSDTVSAYELAKGFTKTLERRQSPCPLPQYLRNAHDELVAKRKLNLILRSHATSSPPIQVGDMVHVYIKRGLEKGVNGHNLVLSCPSIRVPARLLYLERVIHRSLLRSKMSALLSWMNSCSYRY